MVSVTSASGNITSASRYHPRFQSRTSLYIRGLIPRNFAELAEAVPIGELQIYIQVLIALQVVKALADLPTMHILASDFDARIYKMVISVNDHTKDYCVYYESEVCPHI